MMMPLELTLEQVTELIGKDAARCYLEENASFKTDRRTIEVRCRDLSVNSRKTVEQIPNNVMIKLVNMEMGIFKIELV